MVMRNLEVSSVERKELSPLSSLCADKLNGLHLINDITLEH